MATGQNMETITVSSEEQAFELIQQALAGEFQDRNVTLGFEGWPVISLRYEGKDFDSTVTPDVAEAIVELQHALNRTYARCVLHTANARKLTNEQRRELQIKAKVEQGSSLIKIDLGEYVNTLFTSVVGRMSPDQVVISVLGVAAITGGVIAWKAYLKHKGEGKELEQTTKLQLGLSEQETRRAEILAQALTRDPALRNTQQDLDDVRRDFVRSGVNANNLTLQGVQIQSTDAHAIGRTPRSTSEDTQLNGHYIIQKLDWQHPDEVRMWLASTDNLKLSFVAALKYSIQMPEDQKQKLQAAEWERKRLYMTINATVLRGEVTSARIVSVDWPTENPG